MKDLPAALPAMGLVKWYDTFTEESVMLKSWIVNLSSAPLLQAMLTGVDGLLV